MSSIEATSVYVREQRFAVNAEEIIPSRALNKEKLYIMYSRLDENFCEYMYRFSGYDFISQNIQYLIFSYG